MHHVIASADKEKQEVETGDSRVPITNMKCGNAAGMVGPLISF